MEEIIQRSSLHNLASDAVMSAGGAAGTSVVAGPEERVILSMLY